MKLRFALGALSLVTACKKAAPDGSGSGSAAPGSNAVGSAVTPAVASGSGSGSTTSSGSGSSGSGSSGSGSATADVPPVDDGKAPALRMRETIERQVALLMGNKNAELLAMFEPGAVVLVPDARAVDPSLDLVARIAGPGATVTIGKNVEEGDSDGAIWLVADLEVSAGGKSRTVRAVELLDGAKGWKVAVASFAETQPAKRGATTPGPIPAPTDAGPLSALLATPNKIATTLPEEDNAPEMFVLGTQTDERGIAYGDAKLLAYKFGKLGFALEDKDKVHEVRTPKWGYAIANVNRLAPPDQPYRTSGLVIAIPAKDGAWSTVAAVYNAL
jgi:hypothetical protein